MLDDYMIELGFNDDDITYIKSIYYQSYYSKNSLLFNLKSIVNYLHKNGIKNDEIINIFRKMPDLITYSVETIKVKINDFYEYGFNRLQVFNMIKNYPYILKISNQNIFNRMKVFSLFGFSNRDIISLFSNKNDLIYLDSSIIKSKFNFLIEFGYNKDNIISLFNCVPNIIDCNLNTIKSKINYLKELGFNDSEIINITLYIPEFFISDNNILKDKFSFLIDYGFTKEIIISIINKIPYILNKAYIDQICIKLDKLNSFGFKKEDIILLTSKNPYLLLFRTELIDDNYKNLISMGFDNNSLLLCPILLTYNSLEIENRISFYKECNLVDILYNNPKYLLYDLNFMRLKYNYLKNNNGELLDLFMNDSSFYSKYSISRKYIYEGDK